MSDKCKLEIIGAMISNYYEFFASEDMVRNSAALEALISDIDVVISHEEPQDAVCSCSGECHNCVE